MNAKIKNRLIGMMAVFSNRNYLILFITISIIFSFVYIFAWNLILLPDFYIRLDIWSPLNILFLLVISSLSSLVIALAIISIKIKSSTNKVKHEYLAIVPALFISACPGCVPFILSFTSATFAIGLSLARFDIIIKLLTTLILSATGLYMSSTIRKCKNKQC